MQVTVTGRHLDITPAIRGYATQKADRLPRFFDRVQAVDFIMEKRESHRSEVEVKVRADRHDPFIARSDGQDLYACIDQAVDKVERQLAEHKAQVRDRKHRSPSPNKPQ